MKKNFASLLRLSLLTVLLAGIMLQPQFPAFAAANLTITPLTWNVIGLDSNNVTVGPNNFPVGARVCNTGDTTANNVGSAFNWEATDPTPAQDYINLRPGSNSSYSGYTLDPGSCVDFYYEVQVTRNSNAYNDTRRYYITATADTLGTISTPRPREIFVEHLISQNRNAVTDIQLNGTSIPAGGTMSLMVGNTYDIKLVGNTATQGYEQIESFINFPNTIFQVNSVTSTYSANAGTDALAATKPYADGCTWVNDPNSPNYRSCTSTGKYGGSVTVTYNVTIIGGAGTSQTLNTLIYDFSGSSYHYNSDFSTGARFASIVGPSSITITKTFTPKAIAPGDASVLTFRLNNPTTETINGVNFTDPLQGGLKVAAAPNVSYTGCGSGAFSPVPVANDTSLSFSNGTIAPNSTCTISVSVTADTAADYPNTTGNLFINGTEDTGNSASDTLKVSSASACVPGQTLAVWAFTGLTNTVANATAPPYTTKAGNVTTAVASTTTSSPAIETNTSYGNPAPSWSGQGFTGGAYFQFQVDTSRYSNVTVSFNHIQTTASWNVSTVTVSSSTDGTTFTSNGSATLSASMGSSTFNTTAGSTYFRISATGAQNVNSRFAIDNITFTGCLVPAPAPTLTKSFSPDPIVKGGTSTLTFTITNTAAGNVAQSGIAFTDVLPEGLSVANGTASACNGTNNLVTTAATRTISLTGGSLAAGGSCTFNVTVTGSEEGSYENISGFLSSNESGTSTSYATDTLTVIAPPTLEKSFSPSSILVGGTSTLQFTITNPNQTTTLTGINYSDTLPAGVTAADDSGSACNGAWNLSSNVLTFSGGSVNANGSCNFSITVTGASTGTWTNTINAINSTQGGSNNNPVSASLAVSNPQPLIGLLKQISTDNATWVKYVGLIPTANIYYRFTVTNDGETTLNNINVTDPDVNMVSCSPALPVSLAVGESASCVVGPISISSAPSPNPFVNTANVTTDTYTVGDEGTSSAQYGTMSLSLDKTADKSVFFAADEIITYSYLVTNDGGYPLLGPVTVTDDKTTVTCPDVSTVGDNDDYLDPGEEITCTGTYSITAGDVTAGRVTNTASAAADGVDSNTDSVTVTLPPDLTITKTNNVSGSVVLANTFDWTITVTNSGVADASFTDTNVILTDTLPGAAGFYPQGALTVAPGVTLPTGTIDCSITGTALGCAANGPVILSEGASFSVTFTVTPTAAGNLLNTVVVDPDSVVTELDKTNNTGTDAVIIIAPPVITKSFSPNPTVANAASTLTFTITNPNAGVDLTGVAFSDTYPAGLVNAAPLSTTNTCGGTLAAAAGGNSISLSGGSITVNDISCTVTVDVVASSGGSYPNATGTVSSTNGGTGNTASSTLIVFDAQPSKSLVTTSEAFTGMVGTANRVAIGEMIRYRLAAMIPEGSFTNVQLLDGIPTGLQFLNDGTATVAFVCNGTNPDCMTSSTLSGTGLVVNGSTSDVSPTFAVPASAISPATFESGTDVTFSLGDITNFDSDPDAEYVVIEFNALVLNVNATATINQGTNNQTGANIPNNRQNDVTLLVNGATVGSASPNVTVDIAEPAIISITKSVSPSTGPYLPGDSLTYTLSFSNNATGTNAATAFDIALTDTFDSNLNLGAISVSSDQGATCAGGNAFSTSDSTVGQLVTVNVSCLDPGNTVTVTVSAVISNAAPPGTTISNSASLTYTSLPGDQGNCAVAPFTCAGVGSSGEGTGERNGSGGPGADGAVLNNYAAISNTVDITPAYGSITIVKDAVPDDPQDFGFTGTGPNGFDFGGGFDLDDDADATLPNSQTFGALIPGTYSLTETALSGWSLTGLTCTDPDNGSTTDLGTDTASIDLDSGEDITCTFTNTQQVASIVLTKTPTLDDTVVAPSGVVNAGDTITYTFSVENTGDVTVTNITVTDPLLPTLSCTIASLAPGATDNCTATNNVYTLTQPDIDNGSRVNTATATGIDPGNNPVTDDDTQAVNLSSSPSIVLTKTPTLDDTVVPPGGVVNAGDTITYAFSVENTGNVTISNIVVTDPLLPSLSCTIASLAPGATDSCAATNNVYTLTQSDINNGFRANTATATGTDPGDNSVTDTDTRNTSLPQSPSIVLTKTPTLDDTVVPPGGVVNAGDTITYTFSVENTGNITVTDIVMTDPLLPTLSCTITTLAPGATDSCAATNNEYTLTQADIDNGSRVNTATASGNDPNNNPVTDTDTRTTSLTQSPSLNIVKEVSTDNNIWNDASVTVTIGDTVYYRVRVANTGNVTLTGLTVDDGMAGCTLVRGVDITGDNDADFEAGEEWVYTCSVTAVSGTNNNTATADTNETPQDGDSASYTANAALVADPAISKAGNPTQATVGETVTFTLTVTNQGNAPASNVVITDALPAQFDVTAVNVSGAPFGTLVNVTPPIGTGPAPYTVVVTLGGDLGVTDVVTVEIVTTVNGLGNPPIINTARLTTSSTTNLVSNDSASVSITTRAPRVTKLPGTGFAPDVITRLPAQPADRMYAATDLILEIPSLGIEIPIVGVPVKSGGWDVSWLGNQAGWLEGSAFPSWSGNSVLTGHVYGSNGLPGPFVNLSKLKYGDQIVVHAYGQKYTFEVRTNAVVEPDDGSVFKHEERPWLTLVTCKEYDEKTDTYLKRVVVRAVLVNVAWE